MTPESYWRFVVALAAPLPWHNYTNATLLNYATNKSQKKENGNDVAAAAATAAK